MYIEPELKREYEEIKAECPDFDHKMMKHFMKHMPEEAKKMIREQKEIMKYGYHIVSKQTYDEFISKIPNVKWSVEDVVRVSGIDFDQKEYYKYDFAFLMNLKYYKYNSFITDAAIYVKMVKADLECPLIKNADDLAYHTAKDFK